MHYEKQNSDNLIELNMIKAETVLDKEEKTQDINNSNKVKELLDLKHYSNEQLQQLEKIKNQIEYKYENELSTTIPTKSSVTKIKQMKLNKVGVNLESLEDEEIEDNQNINFEKTKFLKEEKDVKLLLVKKVL